MITIELQKAWMGNEAGTRLALEAPIADLLIEREVAVRIEEEESTLNEKIAELKRHVLSKLNKRGAGPAENK